MIKTPTNQEASLIRERNNRVGVRIHFYPGSAKEQESFNFKATVTIWSDFGDQENKICLN